MWAVERGRLCVVKRAMKQCVYLEAEDCDGWTAVMYAAVRGNYDICKVLLHYGADLNHITKELFTALHLAAVNGLIEICLLLIKAGANPYAIDVYKKTPLDYITNKLERDKVKKLMDDLYIDFSYDMIHKMRVHAGLEKSKSTFIECYC